VFLALSVGLLCAVSALSVSFCGLVRGAFLFVGLLIVVLSYGIGWMEGV